MLLARLSWAGGLLLVAHAARGRRMPGGSRQADREQIASKRAFGRHVLLSTAAGVGIGVAGSLAVGCEHGLLPDLLLVGAGVGGFLRGILVSRLG